MVERAALAQSEGKFRALLDVAPSVMAVDEGPDHLISYVNPTWERTVGKPGAVGRFPRCLSQVWTRWIV